MNIRLAGLGVERDVAHLVADQQRDPLAMVDRLIHHAELISLKGDSYRLKDRDFGLRPARAEP
jgi:DNA replication protein DnaC